MNETTKLRRRLLATLALLGAVSVASSARGDNGGSADPGLPLPTATNHTLPDVVTAFDPLVDGSRFVNTGDYATTSGNCLGMALVAIDSYRRRQNLAPAQQPPARPAGDPYSAIDAEQQALAANAHAVAHADEMSGPSGITPFCPAADPTPGLAILAELRKGNPAVLSMNNPSSGGHAVVAYAYKGGQFQLYDPNYPASTQTIAFDPMTGFGKPSELGDDYYAGVSQFRALPQSDFSVYDKIGVLRTDCQMLDSACTARYRPFPFSVSFADGVAPVLTGTIGPLPGQFYSDGSGISPPNEAIVFLDGQAISSAVVSGNDVRVTLPAEAFGPKPAVIEVAILAKNWGLLAINRQVVTPPANSKGGPESGFTDFLKIFWQ